MTMTPQERAEKLLSAVQDAPVHLQLIILERALLDAEDRGRALERITGRKWTQEEARL